MATRQYTTRRTQIVAAFVKLLKNINGAGDYRTDLAGHVYGTLRFWDEIDEFPEININSGSETRSYEAGGFKWRFLSITFRVYVRNQDDPQGELALVLEDLETILEDNDGLSYEDSDGSQKTISDIEIISISTDEGALTPLGVGELIAEIRY
jgi:hypothetical protein